MGAGTRENQFRKRFGQGKPIDTFGIPCLHANPVSPANDKERVEALGYKDTIDAQSFIFWKQAIANAIQDSNLKALADVADDMGDLKSYYENGDLNLVLKSKTMKGYNLRTKLPPTIIEAILAKEGLVHVQLINPKKSKIYSFYRFHHKVERPYIHIPKDIMKNFKAHQEVVVKIRGLPIWEFVNELESNVSMIIGFKKVLIEGKDIPILVANFGGKDALIQSFDYDYLPYSNIGGTGYIEFEVKSKRFRLYDNGLGKSRFAVSVGKPFLPIIGLEYNPKQDVVKIEYENYGQKQGTKLYLGEPTDKIDLDRGLATEEMRLRVASRNRKQMGDVGEEIAAEFAKKKLNAIVFEKEKPTGPDRKIIYDGKPGILEAKLTTYEPDLETTFVEAIYDVCRRFKINSSYRQGVAAATYFDEDTGYFHLNHKIVAPETQDMAFKGLHVPKYLARKIKDLGISLSEDEEL